MKSLSKDQIKLPYQKIKIIITTCLAVLVMSSLSSAADYYVATNGNDANPGTLSNPWKTIGKANSTLRAGDTVFIKAGTYTGEIIRPNNSGIAGSPVTYTNYLNETPVLTFTSGLTSTAIDLSNKNYVVIDGINVTGTEIGDSSHVREWVNMDDGSYNIVQNCDFQKCYGWAGVSIDSGAHHNKVLNNTMKYCGSRDRNNGDMIMIALEAGIAHHNLVEGNTFSYAGHNIIIVEGYNNIVRNNDLSNPWGRIMEVRKLKTYGHRCLFEGNRFHDNGIPTNNPSPPALKLLGEYQIVRRNMFYDNTAHAIQISPGAANVGYMAHHLRIYNNIFYHNGAEAINLFHIVDSVDTSSNDYKNNIIYQNGSQGIWLNPETTGFNNNVTISNNILSTATGSEGYIRTQSYGLNTLQWYENNYPAYVHSNIQTNPKFVAPDSGNFQLQSDSAMINAGAMLSVTTSSGSGTTIPIKDAGYFMDGWGMIEGDTIQLENQSQTAKIIGVDYDSNTLTIDKFLSWSKGQGVSLAFSGTSPDMGVFEYQESDSDPLPRISPRIEE